MFDIIVYISCIDCSRLPDGFTLLLNLTYVSLNDTFLEFLPANIGRLAKLEVLEVRENHLAALPK